MLLYSLDIISFVVCFITELLNIEPAPNNGTAGSLSHILKNPKNATGAYQINTEICNSSKQDTVPMCGCTSINVSLAIVVEKSVKSCFPEFSFNHVFK